MPLPTSFTTFTDGTTITAAEFNKRVVDVETYINGDIESSDLPTGMFVTSSIIVDPEFFDSDAGFENNLLVLKTATFAMFVDGTEVSGTERKVYCACNADDPMAAQNISMVSMVELTRGTHDISIRIKPEVPADKNKFQHTVIRHRTLNIELYYL